MMKYGPIEKETKKPTIHFPFGERMIPDKKTGDLIVGAVAACALILTSDFHISYNASEVTCESCIRRMGKKRN